MRRTIRWLIPFVAMACLSVPDAAWADEAKPAATKPAPPPPKAAAPVKKEPPVTTKVSPDVAGLLGRKVRSKTHENMGQIIDILVNKQGAPDAAVIDFGGFLGVGSRKVAVDWHTLHFPPPGNDEAAITIDFTTKQLTAAPAYVEGKPAIVLHAPAPETPPRPKPSAK